MVRGAGQRRLEIVSFLLLGPKDLTRILLEEEKFIWGPQFQRS